MNGSATFVVRRYRLVRKLLYYLEFFTAAFTPILVQRHSLGRVLKSTLSLERVLICARALRAAEPRRVLTACQLRDARLSSNEIDGLPQQIVFFILWGGSRDGVAILIQLGRIIIFSELNGGNNTGVLNRFA
jgi:hypothetical protein